MLNPFEKDSRAFKDAREAAKAYFSSEEKPAHIGDIEAMATSEGFVKSHEEFIIYMNAFAIELTKMKMKNQQSNLTIMTQVVLGIDDLDAIMNTVYERLSEVYDTYFPEANRKMNLESTADMLMEDPGREAVAKKLKISADSMGIDVSGGEIKMIKDYASSLKSMLALRSNLADYVAGVMNEKCKNLSALCSPLLGAKLIAIAGSLEKLAMMPSSTVQLLGAEKALFRHLKTGAKPPKHGVIIQHPLVSGAENRGRMARALASKIAIAAKLDFYGGQFAGDRLIKELEAKA